MATVTKFILAASLIAIVVISCFAFLSVSRFYDAELREESENREKCLQTFREFLRQKGGEFRVVDGRLFAGDYLVNGNFEIPDKVQEIFGGVATVFQGDTRVSTNVLTGEKKRAVGTKLVGPAYDAVFKEGKGYRGEAVILGIPYLTAYDPIRGSNGEIIGVLFVGVQKSEFLAHFNEIKIQQILMLAAFMAVFITLMVLLGGATRRFDKINTDHVRFLQTLIDTIPSPVFYKNSAGRYLGCNNAFERCVNRKRSELIGKTVHELWSKEQADIYREKDAALFEKPGEQIYEAQVRYADGSLHDLIFSKATFQGTDGSVGGLVGVMLDVTEAKRGEELRSRLKAQLHHSQMMESVLIKLGHDLKTPLTPLLVLLSILRGRVADIELERMADICLTSAHHIKELSEKTLSLAKLTADAVPVAREEIALAQAIDESLVESDVTGVRRDVSIKNGVDARIVVQGIPEQIRELFGNLISNAVRYSPAQGVVRITAQQTESTVTVSVRDDGVGLAPEHLTPIFEEFFKVDVSRHDVATPGLGLSICKRIVRNHQGTIWAESPGIGKGTAILFNLPVKLV